MSGQDSSAQCPATISASGAEGLNHLPSCWLWHCQWQLPATPMMPRARFKFLQTTCTDCPVTWPNSTADKAASGRHTIPCEHPSSVEDSCATFHAFLDVIALTSAGPVGAQSSCSGVSCRSLVAQ